MLRLRTVVIASGIASIPILYVRSRVLSLEHAYPPLPSETTTTSELRTPTAPGTRTAYTDVYGTRVPLSALRGSSASDSKYREAPLEEVWAKAFLQSRLMKLEASIVGYGTPGDLGEQGFKPEQKLVAGMMNVLHVPTRGQPLLIRWDVPLHIIGFFERLAGWGYPWRMMEGGRHEWSVGQVGRLPGEKEDMVEVRFAAAHDYRIVEGETGEGKIIPAWVVRAHRAYARLLLDVAVKEIYAH